MQVIVTEIAPLFHILNIQLFFGGLCYVNIPGHFKVHGLLDIFWIYSLIFYKSDDNTTIAC